MTARPAFRRIEHDAEASAATLPGLLIAAQRVAANLNLGSHGRRRPGLGETFWQFRPFSPDDAPQAIDWRQSAKSDAMFVREREWAAAQSAILWCDASASMRYRSTKNLALKAERAAVLTAAAGILLIEGGERLIRLSAAGEPVRGAATGRLALMQVIEGLAGELSSPPNAATARFEWPLPRHSAALIVSDFLQPVEQIADALRPFADRQIDLHMIQVLDPAEELLPFAGRVRFEDLESEGAVVIDRVEDARAGYQQRFAAHRDGLKALAQSYGWSLTIHHTDQPATSALVALHRLMAEGRR
ncbi:MAG: DUF58 domain-containing protein [Alphaproteobacteria bacterium]|nr:DUF58 domain-containing protein [Alphaproteobacteria bacterium]